MAMRMFRSMRNPSTMAGRTSNTTGSRIRSSARTIREGTVSLVQKARSKAGGAGYAHGTSSDRGLKGSAGQIKQTAANQSKKSGATLQQTRQNTVAALKSAKAPANYGLMNKVGYKVGTRSVARAYKRNVAANNPGQRTGLESRTDLARQRASSVVSATAAKGKTFAQGVRMGSRMPDASLSKVYSAQRYADPRGIDKSVTRVSHATALTTAAGYGVGKAARRTVQGVNAIQDAPGNAVRAMFSSSRKAAFGLVSTAGKVAGGFADAAKYNRTLQATKSYAMNAAHNVVKPGIRSAVESFNRGAEKVFMGIGKGVGYAAAAPSLAVYHGGKALVGGIRANIAASARMKATNAAAMKSPRMTPAASIGQQGKFTPMGRHSVVQAVRIKNVQSGGVYMGQKPKSKPWNLSSNGTVGGAYNPANPIKTQAPHSLRSQASSVNAKVSSSGGSNGFQSFFSQAAGRAQPMVGTPRTSSTLTPPWENPKGERWALKTRKRGVLAARQQAVPTKTTVRRVLQSGQSQTTGHRGSFGVAMIPRTATGIMTSKMSEKISGVVERARTARAGRPATVGEVKFKGPERMKGERGVIARAGVREAANRRVAFYGAPAPNPNAFNLAGEAKKKRKGRPSNLGK